MLSFVNISAVRTLTLNINCHQANKLSVSFCTCYWFHSTIHMYFISFSLLNLSLNKIFEGLGIILNWWCLDFVIFYILKLIALHMYGFCVLWKIFKEKNWNFYDLRKNFKKCFRHLICNSFLVIQFLYYKLWRKAFPLG